LSVGKAGGWHKSSKKEKKRFYSLLVNLRKKLPKDCLEGKASKGYMLSDPAMISQGSGFVASSTLKLLPSNISAPNDSDFSDHLRTFIRTSIVFINTKREIVINLLIRDYLRIPKR
jgi:hypothetical protein